MTTPHQHLPYRKGVGIVLLNNDNQVFTARRIDTTSEAWQMPQGGIDEGEDPRTAALRELEEETSINNIQVIAESQGWMTYDLPEHLVPKIWGGKYRGQEQKWFLCHFLGSDADINLKTSHPEFNEWKWTEFESIPDIIVPFKKSLYEDIVAEFRPLLP
jgi:putative (di)nucleoside polyphosphate hydrolase